MFYHKRKIERSLKNFFEELRICDFLKVSIALPKILFLNYREKMIRIINIHACFPSIPFGSHLIRKAVQYYSKSAELIIDNERSELSYSIIIKPYISKDEKGVLLISFEKNLKKIIENKNFNTIQKYYKIIFLPSSVGFFSEQLIGLAARSLNEFYVMPVLEHERLLAQRLGPNCKALPFNAASWVKKNFFCNHYGERDLDCLMVANFHGVKRHWILFKALSKLPPNVKAHCLGVPLEGRSADSIREEALEYNVLDRITIVELPTQEYVRSCFQRAKVFCALTFQEGSFIAVAESLMSGTPVVAFKNASFGTKNAITPESGALISSISDLRRKILFYLNNTVDHDQIRRKAYGQFDASNNCSRLNQLLKKEALRSGEQWSVDIENFYRMRLWYYYEKPDNCIKFNNDYERLEDFGIVVMRPSHDEQFLGGNKQRIIKH